MNPQHQKASDGKAAQTSEKPSKPLTSKQGSGALSLQTLKTSKTKTNRLITGKRALVIFAIASVLGLTVEELYYRLNGQSEKAWLSLLVGLVAKDKQGSEPGAVVQPAEAA